MDELVKAHNNIMNEYFYKMNEISDDMRNNISVRKNVKKKFEKFGNIEICIEPGLENY